MIDREQEDYQYISDMIGEEYKTWAGERWAEEDFLNGVKNEGDYVFINADMGSGKTFFIFNILASFAASRDKKILYLCNRVALKKDAFYYREHTGLHSVEIMTYQQLERRIVKQNKEYEDGVRTQSFINAFAELKEYDYIVADECHYFLEDAPFNPFVFYSFNFLVSKSPQVKILISATPGFMDKVFYGRYNRGYKYSLRKENTARILQFYRDDISNGKDYVREQIEELLTQDSDEKIIYFANSKKRIDYLMKESELIRDNSHCMFSGTREDPDDINDLECIQPVDDDTITFEKRLLIATSVISNGISLKDRRIKHIFCDVENIYTAIQCMGRKRILDLNDSVNVHMRYFLKGEFTAKWKIAKKQVLLSEMLISRRAEYAAEVGAFAKDTCHCLILDWLDNGIAKINFPLYYRYAQEDGLYSLIDRCNGEYTGEYNPAYGYAQCFEYHSGVSSVGVPVNYYLTDEDIEDNEYSVLQEAYSIIEPLIGEKIISVTDEGKALDKCKKTITKLRRKQSRAAITKAEFYNTLCETFGLVYTDGTVNDRTTYRGKAYVCFERAE